jgi:hypothetical protein
MMTAPSSSPRGERSVRERRRHTARVLLAISATLLAAACSANDVTAPRSAAIPTKAGHASVVVTPDYSTFSTRAELDAAGTVDELNGFDEFTGELVYPQLSPWKTHGVTYTSAFNIVLGSGVGLGVQSNAISTDFGAPVSGSLDDADGVTLFGATLTLIGAKVPVALVVFTNLGSYSFDNLDVPLATAGQRFFGITLSKPGEHLTGFRVSVTGAGTAVLLDDVALGHVGAANAKPVASVGGPYTGAEGSAVGLALSATDGDGDALTYSWDLGDGTTGSGAAPPASHVYADNGAYDIVLAVDDGRGGVDTARTTASISNVVPSLASFSVSTTPHGLTNGLVTVPISATFTDPGSLDTHTATLDCGSGFTAQSYAPDGTASGECSFSSPGVYSIQLTVRDDDGGSDTKLASGQVVVYDAAAGWVTGGGWIASPVGANAMAPTTTGKLTFGFVARYQSGASIPSGNAEFKLSVGKLDFRSTTLDWMVVGDGSAQLHGRGTVNGAGDYELAVIAIDGSATDAIRVQIWNRVTGAIAYDNRPGESLDASAVTALGGGSIQLHSR